MKTKRIIVTLMVLFCMVLIIPGTASAAYKVWECTVLSAGPDTTGDDVTPGTIIVRLQRDGAANPRNFVVKAGEEDRVLAIALTAISAGLKVKAGIDWNYIDGDYIDGIWLIIGP